MNATQPRMLPERLEVTFTLAHLLQKLDASPTAVAPDQYRSVVSRLSEELARLPMDDDLQAVLNTFPSAAELYENQNYQHAGLCRSPLEAALSAEVKASELIRRITAPARD
jgi:hypothetical protein